MAKKEINCFGFDVSIYNRHENTIEPYQFVKDENVIYVRFENKNPCTVVRITKNGNSYTQMWAYGDWNSCTTLDYDKTINETRLVDEEA